MEPMTVLSPSSKTRTGSDLFAGSAPGATRGIRRNNTRTAPRIAFMSTTLCRSHNPTNLSTGCGILCSDFRHLLPSRLAGDEKASEGLSHRIQRLAIWQRHGKTQAPGGLFFDALFQPRTQVADDLFRRAGSSLASGDQLAQKLERGPQQLPAGGRHALAVLLFRGGLAGTLLLRLVGKRLR